MIQRTIFNRSTLMALVVFISVGLVVFLYSNSNSLDDPANFPINVKADANVDLSLAFTDQHGNTRTLSNIANSKPLIIVPVYYGCPQLCGLALQGLVKLIRALDAAYSQLGREYTIATISFNDTEGTSLASRAADRYHAQVPRGEGKESWFFMTGSKDSIQTLMYQLGFVYKKIGTEIGHSTAIFIISPQGSITQHFAGVEFSPVEVRMALAKSRLGILGGNHAQSFLSCFNYDPQTGEYSIDWLKVNLLGAALLCLVIGIQQVTSFLRKKQKNV